MAGVTQGQFMGTRQQQSPSLLDFHPLARPTSHLLPAAGASWSEGTQRSWEGGALHSTSSFGKSNKVLLGWSQWSHSLIFLER